MKINRIKIDVSVFLLLFLPIILWMQYLRSPENINKFDTYDFAFECEDHGSGKYGGIKGYLYIENEKLMFRGKFKNLNACQQIGAEMEGKAIMGKFLTTNGLITELSISGKNYYAESMLSVVFYAVFFSFVGWAVLKTLIIKFGKKSA